MPTEGCLQPQLSFLSLAFSSAGPRRAPKLEPEPDPDTESAPGRWPPVWSRPPGLSVLLAGGTTLLCGRQIRGSCESLVVLPNLSFAPCKFEASSSAFSAHSLLRSFPLSMSAVSVYVCVRRGVSVMSCLRVPKWPCCPAALLPCCPSCTPSLLSPAGGRAAPAAPLPAGA